MQRLFEPEYTAPALFTSRLTDARLSLRNHVLYDARGSVVRESIMPLRNGEPISYLPYPFDAAGDRPLRRPSTLLPIVDGLSTTHRCVFRNYYHTLIDSVPRLYLLHQSPWADAERITVLVGDEPAGVEAFLLDRLLPQNARVEVRPEAAVRAESFVFLSFLSQDNAAHLPAEAIAFMRDRLLPKRPSTRSRRIYVSRERSSARRCLNRAEVARALDLEVHAPEDYTPAEQIELFHDAEIVVGPHGAGLANLLYAPHGTPLVELFPTAEPLPYFGLLSAAMGGRYAWVCGSEPEKNDAFTITSTALHQLVREVERSS